MDTKILTLKLYNTTTLSSKNFMGKKLKKYILSVKVTKKTFITVIFSLEIQKELLM